MFQPVFRYSLETVRVSLSHIQDFSRSSCLLLVACVASVPVRSSEELKSVASEERKILAARNLPPPSIFCSRPNFARPESFALRSRQILALCSIARERLLRRLLLVPAAFTLSCDFVIVSPNFEKDNAKCDLSLPPPPPPPPLKGQTY